MNGYNQQNEQGSALKRYATDLIDLAKKGKLDPVIGREKEIDMVVSILCRKHKRPSNGGASRRGAGCICPS